MADHRQLRPMLLEAGKGVFAVIDGAQFDDLPVALFGRHFVHTPLYTNRGNLTPDQVKTAPQLVWLDRDRKSEHYEPSAENFPIEEQVLDRLFDLVEERPAVVFWQCEAGAEVLYRHLRTINMVLYPTLQPGRDGQSLEELVVFRHADSNVMAQVLPALFEPNYNRVIGPAKAVWFIPCDQWGQGPQFAVPKAVGIPIKGLLKLHNTEVAEINSTRKEHKEKRISSFLRKVSPENCADLTNAQISIKTKTYISEAESLGITSEAAQGRWAYLRTLCRYNIFNIQQIQIFFTQKNIKMHPNDRVKILMRECLAQLESRLR